MIYARGIEVNGLRDASQSGGVIAIEKIIAQERAKLWFDPFAEIVREFGEVAGRYFRAPRPAVLVATKNCI